jgi:hypothetical protein
MSDTVWDFQAAGTASLEPELRLPDIGFRCAWSKPGWWHPIYPIVGHPGLAYQPALIPDLPRHPC